jgi:predicted acylesterase/phospholipase RssA
MLEVTGMFAGLPEAERPPIGIALGGGAARGLSHIGVLKVLSEKGIVFPVVAGTSMGAIVGAAYVCGRLAEVEKAALGVTARTMAGWADLNLHSGALKGDVVKEIFRRLVGDTTFADLRDRGINFTVVAADLDTEEPVYINEGRLDDAVRASMSIPGIFEPILLDGRVLVDGGLIDNVPVGAARDLGAAKVIGVEVHNPYDIWVRTVLGVGLSLVQMREIKMRLRELAREQHVPWQRSLEAYRGVSKGMFEAAQLSLGERAGQRSLKDFVSRLHIGRPGDRAAGSKAGALKTRGSRAGALKTRGSKVGALKTRGSKAGEREAGEPNSVEPNSVEANSVEANSVEANSVEPKAGEGWTAFRATLAGLDIITSVLESGQEPFRANTPADLFIRPHVLRFHAHQFYRASQLIAEGERAAREALPQVEALLKEATS